MLQAIYMPKEKKGEGFHSAAGLIRYFDAEEKTRLKIHFSPASPKNASWRYIRETALRRNAKAR